MVKLRKQIMGKGISFGDHNSVDNGYILYEN